MSVTIVSPSLTIKMRKAMFAQGKQGFEYYYVFVKHISKVSWDTI